MNVGIRRRLAMATRVRDFSRAHPDGTAGYTETLARLEDRVSRAEALATQQATGYLAVRASTAKKLELRRHIREEHLKHLARIAHGVSEGNPELTQRFQVPQHNLDHQHFLAAARAMAAEATAQRAIFLKDGMPESFEEDLSKALAEYELAVNEANSGTALHVGARADLKAVSQEIMLLVKRLDAINRYRFRSDTELLAAWLSARDVAWPQGVAKPAGVVVKPAA
jgi:hypothetical protein